MESLVYEQYFGKTVEKK